MFADLSKMLMIGTFFLGAISLVIGAVWELFQIVVEPVRGLAHKTTM